MFNPYDLIFQELQEIKEVLRQSNLRQDEAPEIIDRTELLRRLKITEPTLIRYVKRKVIPELKIGVNCRYNWPKVVAALEKKAG